MEEVCLKILGLENQPLSPGDSAKNFIVFPMVLHGDPITSCQCGFFLTTVKMLTLCILAENIYLYDDQKILSENQITFHSDFSDEELGADVAMLQLVEPVHGLPVSRPSS